MVQKSTAIILLAIYCLLPTGASALGLGDIHLHSVLNQALDAEIDLLPGHAQQVDEIRIELASSADFERIGIPRPHLLAELNFAESILPIHGRCCHRWT